MGANRGSFHSRYPGLLPIQPSDEFVRPVDLRPENVPFPYGQTSLRKQTSQAFGLFLVAFCMGVAATLVWQSYGDAAREMIAKSYPQFGWLAPRPALTPQNPRPSDTIGLATPAAPSAERLNAMSLDLDTAVQNVDKIAATVATGKEQMLRSTGETVSSIGQTPSAEASGMPMESSADEASLQPTVRLDIKSTEDRPRQTLSEGGKPLSPASGRDVSCFSSASAVQQIHPGAWPSWTMRAPGHEGIICWYVAARPRTTDRRPRAMMPKEKEIAETGENGLSGSSALHRRARSWEGGLP
jgi:hypothetical protein